MKDTDWQYKKEANTDKVKDLAECIIEECRQQGFKVHDFEYLQELLAIALDERVYKFKVELF